MTGVYRQRTSRSALVGTETLAANRATGQIGLAVGADGIRTRRLAVHEIRLLARTFSECTAGHAGGGAHQYPGGMTGGDEWHRRSGKNLPIDRTGRDHCTRY